MTQFVRKRRRKRFMPDHSLETKQNLPHLLLGKKKKNVNKSVK